MNTYPTTNISWGSDETPVRETLIDRASNGAVHARLMHDAVRKEIKVQHEHLTTAQKDVILTFYDDNAAATFNYTRVRDGVTKTRVCIFAGPPKETWVKGNFWMVESKLVEV